MVQCLVDAQSTKEDAVDGEHLVVLLNLATSGREIKAKRKRERENELVRQIMAIVVRNRLDLASPSV